MYVSQLPLPVVFLISTLDIPETTILSPIVISSYETKVTVHLLAPLTTGSSITVFAFTKKSQLPLLFLTLNCPSPVIFIILPSSFVNFPLTTPPSEVVLSTPEASVNVEFVGDHVADNFSAALAVTLNSPSGI